MSLVDANHRPLAVLNAALAATERAAEEPRPEAAGMLPSIRIDSAGAPSDDGHILFLNA